jgi:hypothetical protein
VPPVAWAVIVLLLAAGLYGLRRVGPKVSATYHAAVQAAQGRGAA